MNKLDGNTEDVKFRIFSRWDTLYRKLKYCNERLLVKSNNETGDDTLIEDSFLFYISSFGLSFIKNLYLHLGDSLGNIVNIRCLLEGIALLDFLGNDKHNPTKIALLRVQSYILERNVYKNYPSMNHLLFDLGSIQRNYDHSKEKFKSLLDLNSKKFSYLENTSVPFIEESESFESIIGKVHGDSAKHLYKLLSLLSHPHDFRNTMHIDNYINDINEMAVGILESRFSSFTPHKGGLETEYDNTLRFSPIPAILRNQNAAVKRVCSVLYEHGYIVLSSLFYEISLFQWDYYLDLAFGFSEHATTKWKYFAELYAIVLIFIQDEEYAKDNQLFYFHTQMHVISFSDTYSNENDWNLAYLEYLKLFPNGVELSIFKNAYKKTLGFLIDTTGAVPSLRFIVNRMIDHISPMIDNGINFDPKHNIMLSDYLKMKYDESQIMSHANGYMFFAPSGSWSDGQNLMVYSDHIFNTLLRIFMENEVSHRTSKSKTVRNIVRNYLKESEAITYAKHRFFASPKINKDF